MLGQADNAPSLHRYLYAYQNPTVFVDPDGRASVSTMIERAAEGCGTASCAGYASLLAVYQFSTAGFAAVHDPLYDAYEQGRVSGKEYVGYGIGGGAAVAAVSLATLKVGGPLVGQLASAPVRVLASAGLGATVGGGADAATQGLHIKAGIQEEYDPARTVRASVEGAVVGATFGTIAEVAAAQSPRPTSSGPEPQSSATQSTTFTKEGPATLKPEPAAPPSNPRYLPVPYDPAFAARQASGSQAAPRGAVPPSASPDIFPQSLDDLLPELPRDRKGYIYPNERTRIRPEQHPMKPGESNAPRHHDPHYHVETRSDPGKSWKNKANVTKVKPPDYKPGEGTGFKPGEKFPGETIRLPTSDPEE